MTVLPTILAGPVPWILHDQSDGHYHCCVTSPPYWGLRDYGGDKLSWPAVSYLPMAGLPPVHVPQMECCLGLEPTPEAFIAHLVIVFREVKRVLREDGTLWLNLGDSYASGELGRHDAKAGARVGDADPLHRTDGSARDKKARGMPRQSASLQTGLKAKDLIGIPWRAALALQADGWYLRSEVIWAKPNPMPESVTDRPTKAHEQVFLFSKSPRYFYDADAVREPLVKGAAGSYFDRGKTGANGMGRVQDGEREDNPAGRNMRTVWTIATRPSLVSHFAVMAPDLAERCIKAGTSEFGCCPECGRPWERIVERERTSESCSAPQLNALATTGPIGVGITGRALGGAIVRKSVATGSRPSCPCSNTVPVPCRVLDPFGGSGTTASVAIYLKREGTICEPNSDYHLIVEKRMAEVFKCMSDGKMILDAEKSKGVRQLSLC